MLYRNDKYGKPVSHDIQRVLWSKLFLNLSVNSFTAITRSPIGSMIDNDYAWFFAEKMICEAIDVAEAEGQHFSYLEVLNSVHKTCETISGGFSSMSQDVMNCRKTEIDAINPKNAEEMLDGMSRQLSLAMKHVEMLSEELANTPQKRV